MNLYSLFAISSDARLYYLTKAITATLIPSHLVHYQLLILLLLMFFFGVIAKYISNLMAL